MTTPQMDWLNDQRRGVLGAGFYGPTEGEKRRRRNTTPWLLLDDEGDVFCEECWNP